MIEALTCSVAEIAYRNKLHDARGVPRISRYCRPGCGTPPSLPLKISQDRGGRLLRQAAPHRVPGSRFPIRRGFCLIRDVLLLVCCNI